MRDTKALCIVAALSSAGCGSQSAAPEQPGSPSGEGARPAALPSPAEEEIASSECDSIEACRPECEGGAVNACTRLADRLYEEQPGLAEEEWQASCEKKDAEACARLMQLKASEPALTERYGRRACGYGDVGACEYLGTIWFTRARSSAGDEDPEPLFRRALQSYRRACELTSWFGCARAAIAVQQLDAPQSEEARRESQRAIGMARASCDEGDASACRFIARHAENSGHQDLMKAAYSKGCGALLMTALPHHHEEIEDRRMCERAKELGVAPARPRGAETKAPGTREPRPSTVPISTAERISGETAITPPHRVQLALKEHDSRLMSVVRLCLSRHGMVSSLRFIRASRSPQWDGKILEAMRQWRYEPFAVDGEPQPVCTAITFIYTQS